MKVNSIMDINSPSLFYKIEDKIINVNCYLKIEHLNLAGSIKLKSALGMIKGLEYRGELKQNHSVVVCSSSGNLAIALCLICKEKGYPLICISDPNISPITEKQIKLLGATFVKVDKPDKNGGYLSTRLKLIDEMLTNNKHYVFVNQYADEENSNAHYLTTAYEILHEFERIDYLFIGAGTTGTLMGCAKFFKKHSPSTKIIAIDSVGSVTFGKPPAKRYIPGLGTSVQPKILNTEYIDELLMIEEKDTLWMCHYLLKKKGLMLGGSSGTVMQGVKQFQNCNKEFNNSTCVAISPDGGERYLNTVYDDEWVIHKFGSLPIIE